MMISSDKKKKYGKISSFININNLFIFIAIFQIISHLLDIFRELSILIYFRIIERGKQ